MAKAKAIQVVQLSEDVEKNLKLVEKDIPKPGEGQALVRLKYRPVNPSDVYRITSVRGARDDGNLPYVPGLEGMGVVEELGPGPSKLSKGQRVVGVPWPTRSEGQGTWQQYVVVPQEHLVTVPDGVDDKAAAQFLVNPVTAFGMLEDLAPPPGAWVLQTAAGSVLGKIFVALARRRGVKTINVVRRSAQRQEILDAGGDEVIATDKEDVEARVAEITGGKGAFGAVDAVGGETTAAVVRSLREGGRALLYGALSGATATINIVDLLYKARKLEGWILFGWLQSLGPQAPKKLQEVWELFLDGTIVPHTGEVFPLDQAAAAVKASLKEARGGKVLLEG